MQVIFAPTTKFAVQQITPIELTESKTGTHRYYRDSEGRMYPSITTILSATKPERSKQALEDWKERVGHEEAHEISQESIRWGHRLHHLCENYVLGNQVELDLTSVPDKMFVGIAKVIKGGLRKVYGVELTGACQRLKVAGSSDLVCQWLQDGTIVDYKNSRKPKMKKWIRDYILQGVGYSEIMNSCYPELPKINKTVILVGVKDGDCQPFDHDITEDDREEFRDRVRIFHKLHG